MLKGTSRNSESRSPLSSRRVGFFPLFFLLFLFRLFLNDSILFFKYLELEQEKFIHSMSSKTSEPNK